MAQLEPLEAVAVFSLSSDDVYDGVDELGALRVVTLRPVVARAALAEHVVVGPEELAESARPHRVHGARLQVDQYRPRYVLATCRKYRHLGVTYILYGKYDIIHTNNLRKE